MDSYAYRCTFKKWISFSQNLCIFDALSESKIRSYLSHLVFEIYGKKKKKLKSLNLEDTHRKPGFWGGGETTRSFSFWEKNSNINIYFFQLGCIYRGNILKRETKFFSIILCVLFNLRRFQI